MNRFLGLVAISFVLLVSASVALAGCRDRQPGEQKVRLKLIKLGSGTGRVLMMINLDLCDPVTGVPLAHSILCDDKVWAPEGCPENIRIGDVITAYFDSTKASQRSMLTALEGGGRRHNLAESGIESCNLQAPAHWESYKPNIYVDGIRCVAGKDPLGSDSGNSMMGSRKASKDEVKTLPICRKVAGYTNTTLTIVMRVTPGTGTEEVRRDAGTDVASRLLRKLNANTRGLRFVEASGQDPEIRIDVVWNETGQGTKQSSATAVLTGRTSDGRSWTLNANSGPAPYTSEVETTDGLGIYIVDYLANGWQTTPPCVESDRSVRTSW